MTNETRFVVSDILHGILKNAELDAYGKYVNAPQWYKDIKKIMKKVKKNYNPIDVGQTIVKALNAIAPSVLLLNDLHNLETPVDMDNFVRVLQEIIDHSKPGVLVMISCNINYFQDCINKHKSLTDRLNENMVIPQLNKNEASLLIAKRMLEKRMVDNLEPLYPYTENSAEVLNEAVDGNPRNLLKIASFILDQGADSRTMTINEDFVREKINLGKNKTLDEIFEQKDIERHSITGDLKKDMKIPIKPLKKGGFISRIGGAKKEEVIMKHSSVINELEKDGLFSKKIDPPFNLSNYNNQETDKSISSNSDNKPFDFNNGFKDVRVRCPKCSRIFVFQLKDEGEQLNCPNPNCDFSGVIKKK